MTFLSALAAFFPLMLAVDHIQQAEETEDDISLWKLFIALLAMSLAITGGQAENRGTGLTLILLSTFATAGMEVFE